jgi:hypothetical protein
MLAINRCILTLRQAVVGGVPLVFESAEAVGLLTGLEQAGSANKLRRKDKTSLIYRPDLGLLAGSLA